MLYYCDFKAVILSRLNKKYVMKVKFLFIVCACLLGFGVLKAQELSELEELDTRASTLENSVRLLQKFKVSGYIQAQYQYAQTDADGTNFKLTQRRNAYETAELKDFGRFGLRRGRFKLTYEDGIASGVVQIDVTEKGTSSDRNVVMFKDIYLQVKDPWFGTSNLKAGIFDRTFGHEISYSSSRRESPERSRIFQSLFPDERDLGVALTLQPPTSSPLKIFKLEAGLFAGNGIKPMFTNHMDFIGHLTMTQPIGYNALLSGGISAYLGGTLQQNAETYVVKNNDWVLDSDSKDNIGKYAKRQYFGIDLQFSTLSAAGLTYLRGEYIFGEHGGEAGGAYGFNFNGLPPSTPVYMRKINGGYALLTQDLGESPFSVIIKYDWYNRNTGISGNDVKNANDLSMSNIGLGMYWRINPALRLTAYYDIVKNETTDKLTATKNEDGKITANGWDKDRNDNVFTLRLQYKF